jgi:tRNA-specific 2-thiouridylase
VVDTASGDEVGTVEALELVTVGQRRGFAHGADGTRRYVSAVDADSRTVFVGPSADVATLAVPLVDGSVTWTSVALGPGSGAIAQTSAHGRPLSCTFALEGRPSLRFEIAIRPVAPGQTVALYDATDPDRVLGAGIVA